MTPLLVGMGNESIVANLYRRLGETQEGRCPLFLSFCLERLFRPRETVDHNPNSARSSFLVSAESSIARSFFSSNYPRSILARMTAPMRILRRVSSRRAWREAR